MTTTPDTDTPLDHDRLDEDDRALRGGYGYETEPWAGTPHSVIGRIDTTPNGNTILRVGQTIGDTDWTQTEHIVLTPAEVVRLAYDLEPSATGTGYDDIDAAIAGLREVAAWRDRHRDIRLGIVEPRFVVFDTAEQTPADIVRALTDGAAIGSIEKRATDYDGFENMHIGRTFTGDVVVTYVAARDEVCVRRVVGTETVEIPDPDAPLVAVEREIVEWDCAPILGGAAA